MGYEQTSAYFKVLVQGNSQKLLLVLYSSKIVASDLHVFRPLAITNLSEFRYIFRAGAKIIIHGCFIICALKEVWIILHIYISDEQKRIIAIFKDL
jgi:hypothetical protein